MCWCAQACDLRWYSNWAEIGGRLITPESDSKEIVVSIICLTYNQEAYIAKALDGFVMQETSFPMEAVVHDDASTDGTAAVIRHYEAQYPTLFRCIYQTENQYSKKGHIICNDVVHHARGRYIALCEGDDYWTDAKKLEKQVAFMQANPDCAMSFHAARIDYADGTRPSRAHCYPGRRFFSSSEVIVGGGGFYMTCTAMFRRDVLNDCPPCLRSCPVGDIALALNAVVKGRVGYLDEMMAVYRCGVPGSFTERACKRTPCESLEFLRQLADAETEFDKITGYTNTKWITRRRSKDVAMTLLSEAFEPGRYRQYRAMRSAMLFRHRVLFHIGYVYFWLKRWGPKSSNGRAQPKRCEEDAGDRPSRGW